jgi:hypothetical protein
MKSRLILVASMALVLSAAVLAVVVRTDVTPAYVKQEPKAFAVTAERRADGLVHFTITRQLKDERYVVASLVVRDGETVIAESHIPAFVRERSATYYVAVAPAYLADSTFELADRSFGGDDKTGPVPLPGGIDFHIALKDFAPPAAAPIR